MANDDFADAALVLLGHGSTRNAGSSASVFQHAASLRSQAKFAAVFEAFWKQEPQVIQVLAGISARRVFIVPLFTSEGYFADDLLPRELGFSRVGGVNFPRVRKQSGQSFCFCGPVGTHKRMVEIILSRAREVVTNHPFPRAPKPGETALCIAGHGTPRNENSRRAVEFHADRIAARASYAEVHAVFLEEPPLVSACYELAQARNIVLVPFFVSEGPHAVEDLPILLGESERLVRERLELGRPTWRNPTERRGKLVWCASSVGSDPGMAEVILEKVREASGYLNFETGIA